MMEKYQDLNPNNSRIYVDYRKDKDKVRFEYVGKDSPLKVALQTSYNIILSYHVYLFLISTILLIDIYYKNKYPGIDDFVVYNILIASIGVSLFIIPYYGLAIIISQTKLIKYMPKLSALTSKYYEAVFTKENTKSKIIEIPMFSNVILEYKATLDFSYYLERVEIIEHPFDLIVKKKKETQQYLWKAMFYYNKIPKEGELKVRFY